jgi:hypothetical protein
MLEYVDFDVVLEEDEDDIMEDIERLEEFLADGPRPEQSWDYSPMFGPSGLHRRALLRDMDDLIYLDAEEYYSEDICRLLRL